MCVLPILFAVPCAGPVWSHCDGDTVTIQVPHTLIAPSILPVLLLRGSG